MSTTTIKESSPVGTKPQTSQSRPNLTNVQFTETTSCPVCRGSKYEVIRNAKYPEGLTQNEILKSYHSSSDQELMDQLVECLGCNLVYLNPRVKESIILQSYSDAIDPVFFAQNQFRIQTFSRVLKNISKTYQIAPTRDNEVLDIGCAGGAFPKAAADLGFKVTGVEPSRWLVEEGKRQYGLDLRQGILQDHDFESEKFRIVTLWDVVEHLTKPVETLTEIKRILRKDGLLIVNYPDHASIARLLMGFKWPFFLSVHLFYFTPKTIKRLLNQLGFETIAVKPYWQTLEFEYVLKRAASIFPILKPLPKIARALGLGKLPLTYNLGQSMVVARVKS